MLFVDKIIHLYIPKDVMDIFERIRDEIKKESDASGGQVKYAQKVGMTQPSISRYLKYTSEEIRGMKLETFFKLFPDADIIFRRSKNENIRLSLYQFVDKLTEEEQFRLLHILPQIFPDVENNKEKK